MLSASRFRARAFTILLVLLGAGLAALLPGCVSRGVPHSTVETPLTTFAHTNRIIDMNQPVSISSPLLAEVSRVPDGFFEALLSVNADVPPTCGIVAEIRVGLSAAADRAEFWSPWMPILAWGEPVAIPTPDTDTATSFGATSDAIRGQMEIDVFVGAARTGPGGGFDQFQWRIRATGDQPSIIRRVATTTTRELGSRAFADARSDAAKSAAEQHPLPNQRLRPLDVPHRSQKTEHPEIAGRICSPTSVAMVLAYLGKDHRVLEVAQCAYDGPHDVYGNWPRNIQAAYTLGARGFLTRLATWDEAEAFIRRGTPLIISIRFGKHEMPAAFEQTDGHLIVLTGFTGNGDAVVNDPAFGDPAQGRRVYPRADLERAWLSNTAGTTYVLGE